VTSIADRRTELTAALVAGGVRTTSAPGEVQPPCAVLISAGSDMDGIGRGQVPFGFRIVLAAGAPTVEASADALDALTGTTLTVLRGLDGWRIQSIAAASIRDIAGALLLSSDVTAEAMIDL
jgi:hypothetical protein